MTRISELHRAIRNAKRVIKTTKSPRRIAKAQAALEMAKEEITKENRRQRGL